MSKFGENKKYPKRYSSLYCTRLINSQDRAEYSQTCYVPINTNLLNLNFDGVVDEILCEHPA